MNLNLMSVWRAAMELPCVFSTKNTKNCVCAVYFTFCINLSAFFLLFNIFLNYCLGCFCGLGLAYTNKTCTMPPITFQDLPLNIYMVIFGTGIFVFILSLIFCCYFIRWEATHLEISDNETSCRGWTKQENQKVTSPLRALRMCFLRMCVTITQNADSSVWMWVSTVVILFVLPLWLVTCPGCANIIHTKKTKKRKNKSSPWLVPKVSLYQ